MLVAASMFAAATSIVSPEETAYLEAKKVYDTDHGKALAAIEKALAAFPSSHSVWIWRMRVLRGQSLVFNARFKDAIDALTPELPPTLATSEDEVSRLRFLAISVFRNGDQKRAATTLDRARRVAAAHQPRLEAVVLATRANFEIEGSAYDAAIVDGRRARRIAERYADPVTEFIALAALGRAYTFEERYDEAIETNEASLALAKKLGRQTEVQQITGNLGWAYGALGDYETAVDLLQDALAMATRSGAISDVPRWLQELGDIRLAQHDYAGAMNYFRDALQRSRSVKDVNAECWALFSLADLALRSGDYASARQYNEEAIGLRGDDRGFAERGAILAGRIAVGSGDSRLAEETLKHVAADAQRNAIRWEAHARLGHLYAATQRISLADSEYRAAIDEAVAARAEVTGLDLRLPFLNTVAEFYDDYIDFLIAGGRVAEALQVADLARARSLAEGVGVPVQRVDAQRAAREAGVVVLSYWLAPEKSYVWVVTPQVIEVFLLPGDTRIAADVDAYQKELTGTHASAESARGAALYRTLVEPATRRIARSSRVAIIPDGRLHAFNFETLVVPSPQPHYWIEDVILETAPSLQFLGRAQATKGGGSMLLVGNPPQVEAAFPALSYAPAEMERVSRHFGDVQVLDGANATPRRYAAMKPERFAYVHFVAHAIATRQRPLDSAVILGRDANGYKLYARDIIAHPLHARLVTVSSCVSAGRRAYQGEGLVGLAWAFLRAGAHEVIAALWEVNDAATPQLMDAMYGSIRAGSDPAVALRAAKLKLIHSGGVTRRPIYWAPFVLYSGS